MRLTFGDIWPLFVALLIPALWRTQRSTLTDLSRKHLFLVGAARSASIAFLVLALMRPVVYTPVVRFAVAYVVDVSRSVSPLALDADIRWMKRADDSRFPVEHHFIPFAANSVVLDNIKHLERVSSGKDDAPPID